jgi:Ser/Thr protein kinase RdoA (MazF antagonist)
MPDSLNAEILRACVTEKYDCGTVTTCTLVNHSENQTFRLSMASGEQFALRIHRPHYHPRQAIQSELQWMMALRDQGIVTTPRPVCGRDGEFIQSMQDRDAVLTQWEAGTEPVITGNLAEPFRLLGETAARMIQFTRNWQRPQGFTRFTWDFESALGDHDPHWGKWRDGLGVGAGEVDLFARATRLIGQRLLAYGKQKDRFGLAHCDLRLANLLLHEGKVKVLDFDDCGFGWYMYDAATPVSFHEHDRQVPELVDAWKQGFRRVMPITPEDETEIDTFIIFRRLLLVAWVGSHAQTDLAKSLGTQYTQDSLPLCESYLRKFG